MGADEELTFWCFVEFMDRMVGSFFSHSPTAGSHKVFISIQKQNFLRDQSGMKKQLLTLQQLIGIMDPELYRHLGGVSSF
jgi:TBC1 domain family member 15